MTKSELCSVREAAAALGISTQRVAKLIRDGKLPAKVVPEWGRKRYWIPRTAIAARKAQARAA